MPVNRFPRRRTKIVCTIGPATSSSLSMERLIRGGMNVARFNLSHGNQAEHVRYIQSVRQLNSRLNNYVAIMMDLPGPKYRTGGFKGGSALLKKGAKVVLTTEHVEGDADVIPVNLPSLPQDVKAGNTVLLDDGALQLKVLSIGGSEVRCRVVVGGLLTQGRGIVVPGMHISAPFISDRLREDIRFAARQRPDYIALSFVSRPEDVEQVRDILREEKTELPLISKIERGEAVARFDKIMAVSDGIMVARGDLGVEIPLEKVPLVQKDIIRKCNRAGKAVITATQMLESMVNSARPTRAEVADVANAVLDGTDAIMLSAETSVGKYPIQAVKMMAQIAEATERRLPYELLLTERGEWLEHETAELISYNACYTAYWLGASAIVAFTQSGSTARRVSKYRPRVPILAITPVKDVVGRLLLYWGVQAFQIPAPSSMDGLFAIGVKLARDLGLARTGDLIVITGGVPVGIAGTTNLLKVEKVQ